MEETTSTQPTAPKSSNKGMMIIVAVIVVLLIAGGVVVYGMNKSKSSESMKADDSMQVTTTPMKVETTPTSSEGAMMKEVKIEVTGKNFSFTPSTITVKKGEKVTIVFKDVQGFHDFNIDDLKIKTPVIQTGKEAEVTFIPDKTGTFEYYCSVGNHRAMGMKGTLIVE